MTESDDSRPQSRAFFHDRAAEIISAYGADTARWPDHERATALAVIADDRALTLALRDAVRLDGLLLDWAGAPVVRGNVEAAAASAMRAHPAARFWRWAAGSGIAATLAVGIIVINPATRSTGALSPATTTAAAAVSDEQAFSLLFSPTPDEESVI